MDGLLSQSERLWVKEDGHSTKSGRSFGKMEGSKWTVQKCQSGRSESVKVDSPEAIKWTVRKCQSGRSKSVKIDGPNIF